MEAWEPTSLKPVLPLILPLRDVVRLVCIHDDCRYSTCDEMLAPGMTTSSDGNTYDEFCFGEIFAAHNLASHVACGTLRIALARPHLCNTCHSVIVAVADDDTSNPYNWIYDPRGTHVVHASRSPL